MVGNAMTEPVTLRNGTCDIEIRPDGTVLVGKGELGAGPLLPDGIRKQAREVILGADGTVTLPARSAHLLDGMHDLERAEFKDVDGTKTHSADRMFRECHSLAEIDLSAVPFGSLQSAAGMFENCGAKTINLPDDLGPLAKAHRMFEGCRQLTSIGNLGKLDVSRTTDFFAMFRNCRRIESLDGIAGWDMRKAEEASCMFEGCASLDAVPCGGWDTANLVDAEMMFRGCVCATDIPVGNWDTAKLADTEFMFCDCRSLRHVDAAGWDVRNLETAAFMFCGCDRLESADLSGWEPYHTLDAEGMFFGCPSLKHVPGADRVEAKIGYKPGSLTPNLAANDPSRLRQPAQLVGAAMRAGAVTR